MINETLLKKTLLFVGNKKTKPNGVKDMVNKSM